MTITRSNFYPKAFDRTGVLGGGPHRVPCADVVVTADGKKIEKASLLTITRNAGGKTLARATFEVHITNPVTDQELFDGVQEIEIHGSTSVPNSGGTGQYGRQFFWGTTSGAHIALGDERVIIEAAQAPYHFGEYVKGMWELNPQTGAKQLWETDLVFNPTFAAVNDHGRRRHRYADNGFSMSRGNMDQRTGGKGSYKLFLDPLRVMTNSAREWNTDGNEVSVSEYSEAQYLKSDKKWTLAEVVFYLCWTCNENEKYFVNPSRKELEFLDKSEDLIRDLHIPMGTYLPEALDMALHPLGYSWHVDYRGKKDRRITVFKRGDGEKKKIQWQHFRDEGLKSYRTTTHRGSFHIGYQSLVNEVTVYGAPKQYESTFTLIRGWKSTFDNVNDINLTLGTTEYQDSIHHHPVWRNWVLNEAGDYNGTRGSVECFDFKALFGHEVTPRRRRFYPCITLERNDRLPIGVNGYVIEWSNDGGTTWYPLEKLENRSVEILTSECGIRFTGNTPPYELQFAGDDARVRITASVYDDDRLKHTEKRNKQSAQPATAAMLIHKPDYLYRKLGPASKFKDDVTDGQLPSSQVDDTERCKDLAKRIVNAWDQLDVSGDFTLPYFNSEDQYEIGDVITEILGRKVDLEIKSPSEKRYPQITGITWDYQAQTMTLAFETFRDTKFV